MEAMQCLKSIYHNHLLFQEVLVSSKFESKLDKQNIIDIDLDSAEVLEEVDAFSWDKLIIDKDEDEGSVAEMIYYIYVSGDTPSCMYPFIYPIYHSYFTFILLYLHSFVTVWLSP